MTLQQLIAHAAVAIRGEGHNDAPLFDDLSPGEQEMHLHEAQRLLDVLNEQGYIVQKRR